MEIGGEVMVVKQLSNVNERILVRVNNINIGKRFNKALTRDDQHELWRDEEQYEVSYLYLP